MKTKGGIVVEDIKIGDIHYEFEYGFCIKSKVISLPVYTLYDDGKKYWSWQNEKISDGKIINYGVAEKHSHYGPNLYDYEAYRGCAMI